MKLFSGSVFLQEKTSTFTLVNPIISIISKSSVGFFFIFWIKFLTENSSKLEGKNLKMA